MKTLACLSFARHPSSGRIIPAPNDLKAALLAKQLTDDSSLLHVHQGEVPDKAQLEAVLREYACYGFNRIAWAKATNLPAALVEYAHGLRLDYLLFGVRSGGVGSAAGGILPYLVADKLGVPIIDSIVSIEGKTAVQYLPSGSRRNISLPPFAVITVHPLAAIDAPYKYAQGQGAAIQNIVIAQHKRDSNTASEWELVERKRFHKRISIASDASGAKRMRKAIEITDKGGDVVTQGTPRDHAQRIIATLRERQLL